MSNNESALCKASAAGDLARVSALLDEGTDVSYQDEQGMSALMHAADGGHKEVVATLLEAGCPWNLQVGHWNSLERCRRTLCYKAALQLLLSFALYSQACGLCLLCMTMRVCVCVSCRTRTGTVQASTVQGTQR